MGRYVNVLKRWTGKTRATIVYDSTVDPFTNDGLFNNVKGKRNIALVATTTDGDVFGWFYNVAVTKQWKFFGDPTIFAFSFESHGRCKTPQRFFVKERLKENANVLFDKDDTNGFVGFYTFGYAWFCLGTERSNSYCDKMSWVFEGLENTTMTGKNGNEREGPYHHCTRLVAVQLHN